jgi:uncharacterized membrane protein YhaH (DUF805 family)
LGRLFTFHGRGGRGRFWLGVLLSSVLMLTPLVIVTALADPAAAGGEAAPAVLSGMDVALSMLVAVLVIIAFIMHLATGVTRCHDRGKSGFWMLLTLVPIIGFIWWLVDLGILEGEEGPNKHGPPLAA